MPARHQKHRVKPRDCAWYTPPPAPRPALVEQQVWRTVIATVPPGRLTDAQRWALSLWCQLESQRVVALEMLRRIGRGLIDPIIGRDRGGHRTARTPYQQIFRDAGRQQRRLVRLLKFDPAGLLGGWRPGRKATPSPRGPELSTVPHATKAGVMPVCRRRGKNADDVTDIPPGAGQSRIDAGPVDLAEADKPAPMPNSGDLSVMPQGYKCRHDAAEGGWILTGPHGATLNFVPFPNLAAARCFAHDAAGWPQDRRIAHEIAIQQQYVEERQTAAARPAHPADGLTGTASGQPPPFRARLRLPMKAR